MTRTCGTSWTTTAGLALSAATLALLGSAVPVGGPATVRGGRAARRGLPSLPLSARGPIAAALGRADRAYWVRGLSGRNPAQRLRAGFTHTGVTVGSGPGRIGLRLEEFGRAGTTHSLEGASPRVSKNRVRYDHGPLREWYANGPLGLEQGFDLARRPAGGRGPVTLALGVSGNLTARLDRRSVLFSGDGVKLRYAGLAASDARGRPLRAWLGLSAGRLLLRVDDRTASYPVHVDPFIQQAELTAADDPGDELGYSVAVSGDTIVAGAPYHNGDRGAAYVFVKPTAGWANATTQTAFLTASDAVAGDFLGYSVAVSGDTIVAGAPRRNGNAGAGYVFVKPAGGWVNATQTAELTPSDVANTSVPADSVAVSGDTVVVGLPGYSTGQGAAYVYVKPASGWVDATQTAKLTASDGVANDELGSAIAISDNTVVAGAPRHASAKGAAYLFLMPPGGWANATETSELTASDGAANDFFGSSVATSAGTVVAGSGNHAVGANASQGAAYLFVMPTGGWPSSATQTSELTASDGAAHDGLGYPVAISGNTVVAGAEGRNSEQGAAYFFVRPAGGWPASVSQTGKLTASDGVVGDGFGIGVGISGDTIVGSAEYRDSGHGALYVFARPGSSVSIDSPQNGATYVPGQVVNAAFSCSDPPDGSGLAACAGTTANGSPIDTSAPGAYTFTATATDNAGQQTSQTVSYTVATPVVAPMPVVPSVPQPLVSAARQSHKRWRLGSRLARITRKRSPVGTKFSFRLNEAARVRLAFTQRVAGRRVGGRCVAPTRRNRTKPKCTRTVTTGSLSFNGHAGVNAVGFEGRLSRHKKLRRGRYTLVITATNSGGRSKPVSLTFTIVAR